MKTFLRKPYLMMFHCLWTHRRDLNAGRREGCVVKKKKNVFYCGEDLDEKLMAGNGDPVTTGLKEGNGGVWLAWAEEYEGQRCRQGYLGGLEVVDKQEDRHASNDPGTQEKQVSMWDMRILNHEAYEMSCPWILATTVVETTIWRRAGGSYTASWWPDERQVNRLGEAMSWFQTRVQDEQSLKPGGRGRRITPRQHTHKQYITTERIGKRSTENKGNRKHKEALGNLLLL